MKLSVLIIPLFILNTSAICQHEVDGVVYGPSTEIIRKVKEAQQLLQTISYTVERTDTLVTGDTRIMTGRAMIRTDKSDSLFGFEFQAKMDGAQGQSVYSGRIVYETDDSGKTYTVTTDPSQLSNVLWQASGRIILSDLVRLDTSGAANIESWKDQQYIYLRMHYADLTAYDVTRRSKTLTIDPLTWLPVAMRSHQETLTKIQDLYYQIKAIAINGPSFHYDFNSPGFLATYTQRIPQPDKSLTMLTGHEAPLFTLFTFDDQKVALARLRGKVVLLDFWEVWCGACMESMPKVQKLYENYKNQGLRVFGVVNEIKQLKPSKLLVRNRGISYPTLIGNEQLRKDYKLNAIPLLILIDRSGKIIFVSMGFSDELESAVKRTIALR